MDADAREVTHGFELPPADHALLRSAPSPEALRWCERAIGPGATVAAVAALDGGTSSAVHAVDVRTVTGAVVLLVLRRFVRADWLAQEPDLASHEAVALAAVARCPIPTPELVAVDETGDATGVPAVLMTRLDGAIDWRPTDLDPYLERLAVVLPTIHATPVPPGDALPPYAPCAPLPTEPPPGGHRDVWERALVLLHGPPPRDERMLIHRDYHPGNVLWRAGRVSGVVDWVNTSIGSPDADVGHCRLNLAGAFGLAAADRFLTLHRRASGRGDYDPYWDVAAALGGYDEADLAGWTPAAGAFLAAAVARG